MKKILIGIGIFAACLLLIWGIFETAGSDYYNYKGYITEVRENESGETVIVALCGNKESEFTVKWYTRRKAPKNQPFGVGDCVMLSSTRHSDTNIKKIKVDVGYSTEGKLIYTEDISTPFVLVMSKDTGARQLLSVVANGDILSELNMGDTVKLYHSSPVGEASVSVLADAASVTEAGEAQGLTAEDIAFIEAKGYKLRDE